MRFVDFLGCPLDIVAYLEEKNDAVNGALVRLLPKEPDYPPVLHKAMHYSLFAGGKRLRPALVIAASESVGGAFGDVINTACAFECIHTYSLIHDDLPALDNDDVRRGKPTNHRCFGEAAAILAGDALLTVAFELIARTKGVKPELVMRAVLELSRAAGSTGMIGGQMVDIESEGADIPFPVLEYIHIHKTGELIVAAVRCGAILSGATKEELDALTAYGEAVGLAFQIADDILDVEGDAAELGKGVHGDATKGKATYPQFLGVEQSKERAKELVGRALKAISGFDDRAEPLREIAKYVTARRK